MSKVQEDNAYFIELSMETVSFAAYNISRIRIVSLPE